MVGGSSLPEGTRTAAEAWRGLEGTDSPGENPLHHLVRVEDGEDSRPTATSFSDDGTVLAVGFDDGVVQVWTSTTTDNVAPVLEFDSVIRTLAVSPDGRHLAVGTDRGDVSFMTLGSCAPSLPVLSTPDKLIGLDFSPDGRLLAVAESRAVLLWNVQRREIVGEGSPRMSGTQLESIQFDSSGDELIVVAKVIEPATGWAIRSWSPETLAIIREWAASAVAIEALSPTEDGEGIFWSAAEQILSTRLDSAPGSPTPVVQLEWGSRVAVEASSNRVVTSSLRGPIEVFDLRDGRLLASYASAPFGSVISLALSHDGSLVASFMADSSVLLWELE